MRTRNKFRDILTLISRSSENIMINYDAYKFVVIVYYRYVQKKLPHLYKEKYKKNIIVKSNL